MMRWGIIVVLNQPWETYTSLIIHCIDHFCLILCTRANIICDDTFIMIIPFDWDWPVFHRLLEFLRGIVWAIWTAWPANGGPKIGGRSKFGAKNTSIYLFIKQMLRTEDRIHVLILNQIRR